MSTPILSKSSIRKLQVSYFIETMMIVTKKVNKHECQGCTVSLLLLIHLMSHSAKKCNSIFQIITKGVQL